MLVKYINKEKLEDCFEINKLYQVLEVYSKNSKIEIRVICEDSNTQVITKISDFEIIDSRIPPNWMVKISTNNSLIIRPLSIQGIKYSFWEDYFDDGLELEKEMEEVV